MQNKNILIVFTALLALATLYTLSFTYFAKQFEADAVAQGAIYADSLQNSGALGDTMTFEQAQRMGAQKWLESNMDLKAYPLLGHSYRYVKEHELNLGLDLQGGMSVTLTVDYQKWLESKAGVNASDSVFVEVLKETNRLNKEENNSADYITNFQSAWMDSPKGGEDELWKLFFDFENSDFVPQESSDDEVFAILKEKALQAVNSSEEVIRRRIDALGVAQPNIQKLDNGRILVDLPGIDNPERARKQLRSTATLEFWRVHDANTARQLVQRVDPSIVGMIQDPPNAQRRWNVGRFSVADAAKIDDMLKSAVVTDAFFLENQRLYWQAIPDSGFVELYALYSDNVPGGGAELTGEVITDAKATRDFSTNGGPVVDMTMNNTGAQIWSTMTEQCASQNNRPVAVVMDGLVYSAPSVNGKIAGGRSEISFGSGTPMSEAEDLANLLNAGSLDAPLKILNEVTIGPQLGEENVKSGLYSFIIALLVVLAYMMFYYRGAGLVSNIALIANLFLLIGALASLGAALTLPGIAGIVLTIGMAVDANVLIYERIREEMRAGKGLMVALKEGYSKAYSAIIDANLTTLLTAIVLFSFGSGAIRGFATTLIIGIFTSLFSAIVLTRLIFFTRLEKKKNITFYTNATKDWFTKTAINFVGKRRIFYVLSGLVVAGGIFSLSTKPMNYGVEFSGGTTWDLTFKQPVDVDAVRSALSDAFTEDGVQGNPTVQTQGDNTKLRVTTNYLINSTDTDVDERVDKALTAGLAELNLDTEIEDLSKQKVDSSISDEFRSGAQYATIFSLLIIFVYIFFRFRKWQFGLGALIAMVHDVIIVLSIFSIFNGILPFTMEIDQAFVAAILTVIGYSINDTVVVFDRIREYIGLYGSKKSDEELMNGALNSTLSRTINTSLSTFVVLLTIFLFGGASIKGFVFALMVGVVVGTYSSIFIATPSVLDLSKKLTR